MKMIRPRERNKAARAAPVMLAATRVMLMFESEGGRVPPPEMTDVGWRYVRRQIQETLAVIRAAILVRYMWQACGALPLPRPPRPAALRVAPPAADAALRDKRRHATVYAPPADPYTPRRFPRAGALRAGLSVLKRLFMPFACSPPLPDCRRRLMSWPCGYAPRPPASFFCRPAMRMPRHEASLAMRRAHTLF